MDNTHLPPSGDEEARRPTEQFWSGPGPSGQPGPGTAGFGPPGDGSAQPWGGGPAYQQQPGQESAGQPWGGGPEQPGRHPRDRRRLRWSAGVAAAALLAAGGAVLGVSLAGNSAPGSGQAAATSGNAAQGAALSAVLSAADSQAAPGSPGAAGAAAAGGGSPAGNTPLARRCAAAKAATAGNPAASAMVRRGCRRRFILRALALRGVHGEFTVHGKKGFRVLAFERGTIQSVSSGKDIVIRAADGTTWTWQLVSRTVVRESGHKVGTSGLAVGQQVWTGGPVLGGAKDARLIVIRPKSAAPAPAASSSAS